MLCHTVLRDHVIGRMNNQQFEQPVIGIDRQHNGRHHFAPLPHLAGAWMVEHGFANPRHRPTSTIGAISSFRIYGGEKVTHKFSFNRII